MLFDRHTQSWLGGKRAGGARTRLFGIALGLALLAIAPGSLRQANAQTAPNPQNPTTLNPVVTTTPTPWSWPQFKQSPGTVNTGDNYYVSNPGLPTILQDSLPGETTPTTVGTELRGFVLGDYYLGTNLTAQPTDPTFGDYNFYEVADSNSLVTSGVTGFVTPLQALSSSRDTCIQTVDEAGVTAGTTGTANDLGGFNLIDNNLDVGQVGISYRDAAATTGGSYRWTLTAPTAGYYTIYADIPNDTSITRATGASYTIQDTTSGAAAFTGTVDQTGHGYLLVGGVTTTGNNQTITVTLSAATSTGTGEVVADALQLRQPKQQAVDNTDPPTAATADFQVANGTNAFATDTTAQDYAGADYLIAQTLTRDDTANSTTANASYAYWLFGVQTAGAYSLSAYYPVQYQEYFANDAEYTVKIYNLSLAAFTALPAASVTAYLANNTVGTDNLAYTKTITIDQTINGGAFRRVFNTLSIPAGYTCVLQLDNTSDAPTYEGETRSVVADAAELNADDGTVYGTPVAVNTTNDAPELAAGEGNTTANAPGGQGVVYATPPIDSASGALAATATPQIYGEYNNAANIPIGQVAYFGRAENVPYDGVNGASFTPGVAQQNGSVYAIDGLTGSIIWRFGANDTVADDSNPNYFDPGPFSAAEVTTPGTDYYGDGYRTAAPQNTTPTSAATVATWTLPVAAGTLAAAYNVYVWFPSANAGESHIEDAQYAVNDVTATYAGPFSVSQVAGGKWVLLPSGRANNAFVLGPGNNTVTLSDYAPDITTYDGTGAASTTNPQVVADAALFVPINSPGPVMSTPLLVRNMKVIGADGNYYKRDCLIFTDNLGKMYCVDAAGNGDADNTLEDASGNLVSLDAAGYPAVGPTVAPIGGTNAYSFTNTATTGITTAPPYNLHIADYGTTTVYWIWQPSADNASVVLHTQIAGDTADSTETAPDAARDLPAPGAYFTDSPTAQLTYDPANQWYVSTIFVGNPNGTLYSLNGQGAAPNAAPAFGVQPADALITGMTVAVVADKKQYRISQNTTINTVDVNWWFNTGESIASTPAFDYAPVTVGGATTTDGHVYVTTYNSAFNNQGHLYSVDANYGGIGNVGQGYSTPATYNYNVTPLSFWSFPDKYGVIPGIAASSTIHNYNSQVGGNLPALPLGDMAGSPTVENIDHLAPNGAGGYQAHIMVAANDPGPPTQAGSTGFGRVYMVDEAGNMTWAYPNTGNGASPNSVGSSDTTTYFRVYTQPLLSNGDTTDENDFTTSIIADNPNDDSLFVSSSVTCGIIQFPTTPLSGLTNLLGALSDAGNSTLLTNAAVPMAYVGTLGGHLLALDLNGGIAETATGSAVVDAGGHLVSDTLVGDQAPIYSTPALLPGSTGTAKNVGGTVYVNAADPALYELEALPAYTDSNNFPVEPQYFSYNTPGGVSSPSLAAFDAAAYNNKVTVITGEDNAGDITTTTETASGDIEFLYSGSDDGYCFGLTPNTTSTNPGGGGTGFSPGLLIPSGNLPPPTANTNAPNKFIIVRLSKDGSNNYANSFGADSSALYDWGQTATVQVYGVYQPGPTSTTSTVTPPYSLWLSYTLSGGGKQSGGARTIQITAANTVTANVPADVSSKYFDANQTYVTTFPITIGESTAFLPGTRRSLRNLTLTYIDTNGAQQTIRLNQGSAIRYRTAVGSSATTLVRTPLPATLTILNPLAVAAAGKTLNNNPSDFPIIGELGPFGGVTQTFFSLPSTASTGSSASGIAQVPTTVQQAEVNGNPVLNGTPALVAVGLGDIAHNTAGDSSLASGTSNPSESAGETNPTYSAASGTIGKSLLVLADRSALGTTGGSLGNVFMSNDSDTQLAWNDNTGDQGSGSVVNMLSWDTAPVDQHQNPTGNPSSDYPNISAKNLSATLVARIGAAGTDFSNNGSVSPGVSATITSTGGTLAPSSVTTTAGDPTGIRTIYPNPAIVKVAVPRYQPANLEIYRPSSTTGQYEFSARKDTLVANTDVPEGYVAKSRVFVDLSGTHVFNPNTAAYREVSVFVGVPADMGMSIDQPTVDLGTVTAGFADQVTQNINGTQTQLPWWPYDRRNKAAFADPTQVNIAEDYFSQYFQPITVRNNGNVNLLNVHVDSNVGIDTSANGLLQQQSYVRLNSDQAETAYSTALQLDPGSWTDSLAFIPSIDPTNRYFNSATGNNSLLLRSSLDTDVYVPNNLEGDFGNGQGTGHSLYTNATLHKARPGDGVSSILTVPDEPHDFGNPAYVPLTNSVPYNGKPVVGIAVPLGTPVGTYSGTIRTYEGSDPYVPGSSAALANSGYSGSYTGPHYNRAIADNLNGGPTTDGKGPTAFYINKYGVPEQYYSDPGTTLKITVRESQFTDGPPLVGAVTTSTTPTAPFMALPSGDTKPSVVDAASGGPVPTTDVQPFVFAYPNTSDTNLYKMGLLFVSNRDAVYAATQATAANPGTANTFDLYTSAIGAASTTASAFTAPSGPATDPTWWTTPRNQTGLGTVTATTPAAQVSSPFVLSLGTGADQTCAFFVLRNTAPATTVSASATASSTGESVYTIYEAPITSSTSRNNGLPVDLTTAKALYQSTDPIYGVHAAAMPDTGGTGHIVVLWQARVRGHSRVEYLTGTATTGVLIDTDKVTPPQELPVSASLVDVQSPSPVLRYIANTGTAPLLAPRPNTLFTPDKANAIDVTYSGSLQDGTTDLYTSRYYLAPAAGTTLPTLTRIAVVPQNSANSANPFTTSALTLTRSGTDTGLFYGRDVDWAANLSAISLSYTTSTATMANTFLPHTTTTNGVTTITQPYTYDKASGQIVYTNVSLPWTTAKGTVYVNPGLGTVRFSVPPADPTTVIQANVVPLSARITYNSRTNSEPVAFLDDTFEPGITTSSANPIAPVSVSREWFIYRKSGSATGATSATNNTLYYNTRRLTVNLAGPSTTSFATATNTKGQSYLPASFKVTVTSASDGSGTATDVTNLVDVDASRARIYFPSDMEGLYATVNVVNQATTTINTAASPVQIEWQDEPYVNAQSPSVMATGEHVLPIAAAANESNPTAFLDPTSGLNGNNIYVPHRVWVFWSSTRNAAQQAYNGTINIGSTGSDLYYESIDPAFTPALP